VRAADRELARTMVASVQQCIAFGERAGQQVQRIDGTTGIKLSPLELLEKLAALVPLPRVHLVRYGGCLAPPWSQGIGKGIR
jgi:hypothetical protein